MVIQNGASNLYTLINRLEDRSGLNAIVYQILKCFSLFTGNKEDKYTKLSILISVALFPLFIELVNLATAKIKELCPLRKTLRSPWLLKLFIKKACRETGLLN